jgi:hypothetical protein
MKALLGLLTVGGAVLVALCAAADYEWARAVLRLAVFAAPLVLLVGLVWAVVAIAGRPGKARRQAEHRELIEEVRKLRRAVAHEDEDQD